MTRFTTTMAVAVLALGCSRSAPTDATTGAAPTTIPTAAPTATSTASSDPSADATASDGDAPPSKKYDCGARGQQPCPMQKWMKRVLGPASSSGDGPKLAAALSFAATKPPPGYKDWATMANEGAAKAKAGDIEAAKASCRKCHDAYKEHYQNNMRDMTW